MSAPPTPPRWLERLAERAVPAGLSGEGTLGDLAEGFARRSPTSRLFASGWYGVQVASLLAYRLAGGGTDSTTDSDLTMDLRWSVRSLLRHPGFALGVIGVLGVGLASVIAVFSVVDGTVRNASWWSAPERTVAIWPENDFSFGQLDMYGREQAAYRTLGGYDELAFAVRVADGTSESVNGARITPALFRELAAQPALGRALQDDDALVGAEAVVVIGESLWRRSFGGDPGILGSRVEVSGMPRTVVGVQAAAGRAPGGRAELWLPLFMDPRDDDFWKSQTLTFVGVLRDGATIDDAGQDLLAFTDLLSRLFPMFYPDGWADAEAYVTPAGESQRRLISTPLTLLLVGTALLMLVTALNVGNLLLGRAVGRRGELAVRASLGASRLRVVRQLLVEGLLITGLALTAGLLGGHWGGRWIADLFVEQPVVSSSAILSPRVLLFAIAASGLAWLVVNGVPVAYFLRTHGRGPGSGAPRRTAGVQRTLVTVQASLATLLLVSATLLVSTVGNLRDVPLGFDPERMLTVELSTPESTVATPVLARGFYDPLIEGVGAMPGVQSVGLTGWLPLRSNALPTPINLESAPVDPREAVRAPMQMVDPGFFEVFELEPIDGRLLTLEDRAADVPSAIVINQTLAGMLFPGGTAVGQRIAIDPHAWDRWTQIVGVVPDVRAGEIGAPAGPALYVALAESPARDVTLVARTSGSDGALVGDIRRLVTGIDPLVPVRSVARMTDVVRSAYATAWIMMGLIGVLAILATGLGAIGIYAVLAHHVALSRREIGVRVALGAEPQAVVGGVVRSGLLLAAVGIVLGSVGALALGRFMESILYEVSALAPAAFVAPAVALCAAALLAAWIPAARAARLPPAEVLRSE